MRYFLPVLSVLLLATTLIPGCSSHKAAAPPKVAEAPVVLLPDDHNAKVVFRMVGPGTTVTYRAGAPGNLERIGRVYDDSLLNAQPNFMTNVLKGMSVAIGSRPVREVLMPGGQLIEVEGTGKWGTSNGTKRPTLHHCGPLSQSFVGQPNKTYLVEFTKSSFAICDERVFDISQEGQKDSVVPVQR